MNARLAAFALMLGNVVVALAILSPAGMLTQLAAGLSVTIGTAGLLITFGAVLLCFGSPLMAWATSGIARRMLLSVVLAVVAAGLAASALAPNFAGLLVLRLVMLSFATIYTPVAAGTIALMVSEKERPGAIAFVFLGWSLAIAAGLPLITFVTEQYGWRATFGMLGGVAAIGTVLLALALPSGLRGAPLSLASWGLIARNRFIGLLLLITILWTGGQFVIFPFLAPLIEHLAGGGSRAVGACFALMGVMGFLGNLSATGLVNRLGVFNTSMVYLTSMLLGTAIWSLGAGVLIVMGAGVAVWGVGFAAFNSMQQARLVTAAPALASATVALNTSSNYVGQAIGSALGGLLFSHELLVTMGYVATAFMAAAVAVLMLTRAHR